MLACDLPQVTLALRSVHRVTCTHTNQCVPSSDSYVGFRKCCLRSGALCYGFSSASASLSPKALTSHASPLDLLSGSHFPPRTLEGSNHEWRCPYIRSKPGLWPQGHSAVLCFLEPYPALPSSHFLSLENTEVLGGTSLNFLPFHIKHS